MRRLFVLALVVTALVLAGCSTGEVKLGIAASDSTQKFTIGQVIAITLDSNPTTGFGWQVVGEMPGNLQQVGEPEYKAAAGSEGKVGAGGTQTLRFKVVKSGTATLTLGYMRSFEKDTAPAQTYTLTIEATEK